jgi:hypothetical protein
MAIRGSIDIQFTDTSSYKVEIIASNGNIFQNGQISTTFTAVVYRNKENITDTLPPTAFIWRKIDKDGNEDEAWNAVHQGIGNTITVTTGDVQRRATFKCDIDL